MKIIIARVQFSLQTKTVEFECRDIPKLVEDGMFLLIPMLSGEDRYITTSSICAGFSIMPAVETEEPKDGGANGN